jgi:hypothetical protein
MTFSRQPVSSLRESHVLAAAPIAQRRSSVTAMSMECILVHDDGSDLGRLHRIDDELGRILDHGMMSTRSPAISFETACTREPRMPTQAPTGSMRGSGS